MPDKTFEKELEFVQLLCNPDYLKWLYEQGYFEDQSFINLLNHLVYWKQDNYKRYLTYPYCLEILGILLKDDVVQILEDESFYAKIAQDQLLSWKSRKNE
ncbi:mediator of RNA polymerase II transcription subunit 31 (MED31) [Vairimorpha necatrix]|uniref:Mediator of RNA polymerase II transcription subunit 31 n=1 Tax=Vairimorpha necatrix TaxID=6039 RepID=A0AAX4J8S1_9MICR